MLQYVIPLLSSLRPLWSYCLNYVLALGILVALLGAIMSIWRH